MRRKNGPNDDGFKEDEFQSIRISRSEDEASRMDLSMKEEAAEAELSFIYARYAFNRRKRRYRLLTTGASVVVGFCFLLAIFSSPKIESSKPEGSIPSHAEFELERTVFIPEYRADMSIYKHKKTKAPFVAFIPQDNFQDKVFGVGFRTLPSSNNGVAHIMEHSVLSGSEKYPAKDPFLHLLQGSLSTFLNAMTYNDRTLFPVASRNKKDFKNLMSVYLDAVFHPKCITDDGWWILKQEGWRYELADGIDYDSDKETGVLEIKGVVHSEMKGVYSNPEAVISRQTDRLLYPDNPYHYDSGGDPTEISSLTFDEFKDFYHRHYHPTNSKMFVSGTAEDVEEAMVMIHDSLKDFGTDNQVAKNSKVKFQRKKFNHHLYHLQSYAVGKITGEGQHMFCITWLLNDDFLSHKYELALYVLDYLLMGTNSAILYRKLLDSEFGTDVIGHGLDIGLLQTSFAVGMKGVKGSDIADLEEFIVELLKDIIDDGFPQEDLDAAMNSIEFQVRFQTKFLNIFIS